MLCGRIVLSVLNVVEESLRLIAWRRAEIDMNTERLSGALSINSPNLLP